MATRHGAYSPRRVEPRAAGIVQAHLTDADLGYLTQPKYAAAVWAWARAEARVELLTEWVAGMTLEQAAESSRGVTSPLELLRRWEATALSHRGRLGLDPLSRARLSKDVTAAAVGQASLEHMMARGAALAAEHEAAALQAVDEPVDVERGGSS